MTWISVRKKLPDQSHREYLVYPYPDFDYSDKLTAEYIDGQWIIRCEDSSAQWIMIHEHVTHWMPLPDPPATERE